DRDQQQRDDERQPPAPVLERLETEVTADADDDGERDDDAERGRRLQPARVVAAILVGDVLGDVGNGPAIFTAEAETLDEPEQEQDDRSQQTDRCVRRDEPDEGRRETHAAQRDEERVLPADLVTEPAEQEGAQRSDQEADRENRHRAEECRDRMAFLEELDGEDRSQAAEDVEVVPLDDVTHCGRDDDAAQLSGWNLRWRHGPPFVSNAPGSPSWMFALSCHFRRTTGPSCGPTYRISVHYPSSATSGRTARDEWRARPAAVRTGTSPALLA